MRLEVRMVIIQCSKDKKHFQNKATVKGNVDAYIKAMMKIQDKCHICNADLEVLA